MGQAGEPGQVTGVRQHSILLFDKDPEDLAKLHKFLGGEGYRLAEAQDWGDALRRLKGGGVDLLILDVAQSENEGADLCDDVHGHAQTSAIPIIAISDAGSIGMTALNAGADEFMTRPIRMAELLVRTRMLLRLKRLHDDLRDKNEELRALNEELEQFSYAASHDLQEPLRLIRAFGDNLKAKYSDKLDETGRKYIDFMHDAAKRMSQLITDLLELSRVSTRARRFQPVALGEVAREVVGDLDARVREVGGAVELDELPSIDAEPTHMRQLLQNLIANALKFRRPDAPPVVKVASKLIVAPDGREFCQLMVADNGIGFDEKDGERIFGLFQRLHSAQEYDGTGIGLAICQKIARYHGGKIAARSTPGKGSTFAVLLPVHHAPAQATGVPPATCTEAADLRGHGLTKAL